MKILGKYVRFVWFGFALLIYASVLVSPLLFAYGSIISFGIPLVIIANVALLIFSIVIKSGRWWIYALLIGIAYPFFQVSLQFNDSSAEAEADLKILSYNVRSFTEARAGNYQEALDWILNQEADVICFQEFYPGRNIAKRLLQGGNYNAANLKSRYNVTIYSKHTIVNQGVLLTESKINNILFVDIAKGKDTLRVYSAHLQSMGIRPEKIEDGEDLKEEYEDVKMKVLKGSKERTRQMKVLLAHAAASPYPVIVSGDFNDTPFSYNYFHMRSAYKNAFEEAGKGFGFTYNGLIPFLRIDNQFYSEGLEAVNFTTFSDIYYSDHYPIIGLYRITH